MEVAEILIISRIVMFLSFHIFLLRYSNVLNWVSLKIVVLEGSFGLVLRLNTEILLLMKVITKGG